MNGRRLCICLFLCLLGLFPIHSLAQFSPSLARIAGPIDESTRVTLKGNTHPFALPAYDAGVAPDTLPMESIVLILQRGPDKQAALDQLLGQQYDRSSPNFHKWLTPEEFGLRFGPADDDLCAIIGWLAGHGFEVKGVTPGRTLIEFSGTAAQIRNAFHTEIHKYNLRREEHWANDRDPSIPAALVPVVHGILSLNDFSKTAGLATIQTSASAPSTGTATLTPRITLTGTGANCTHTQVCYAVGPGDFATIYDVNPLYAPGSCPSPGPGLSSPPCDGTGQTIAIASSSNINPQDVTSFRTLFNLPIPPNPPNGHPPYANILVIGPDPGLVPGKEGPATLQVQWAGAIAPNATVELVVTQSTTATEGANLSAITAINSAAMTAAKGNLAPILTLSYGVCEPQTNPAFYSFLWEQAAAEGVTVVVPAGDTGAAGCDNHFTEIAASQGLAVNAVASTVYNVAVGGTDFDQVGIWDKYWNSTNAAGSLASVKPNTYIPEVAWNDTCAENGPSGCSTPNPTGSDLVAGGGGYSNSITHPIPPWQLSTGLSPTGGRALPDISLFASDGNNGSLYLVCQGDANQDGNPVCDLSPPFNHIQVGGGTAAAAAGFAGIMALVDQKWGPQGNANFVLYPLAQNAAAAAFHDVTKGNTSVACVGGSFQTCSNPNSSPGSYGIIADVDGAIWSTSPGYDLATGLGSPEVNNLVMNWNKVSFQPTTTTIVSPNQVSSPHGSPVLFIINVTAPSCTPAPSLSCTPTGDVALIVQPNPPPVAQFAPFGADVLSPLVSGGCLGNTVNCSSITGAPGTTTALPGGSYQIVAHYVGDGTFAPSKSTPIPVTIQAQASQTSLSIEDFSQGAALNCVDSGHSEAFGASYYLLVVVDNLGDHPSGAANCFPVISGTNSPTGTVTLNDTVTFPGTNKPPITLPATGPYALNGRGAMEIPTWPLVVGQNQITATYSGDASYAGSSANTYIVVITQGTPRLTLSPLSTLILAGTNVTLTADVSNTVSGARVAPPTETVTFTADDGTSIPPATLSANPGTFAHSTATVTFVPQQMTVGKTVSVSASYSGDPNYLPTTSQLPATITIGTQDFTVPQSVALSLIAGKSGSATMSLTSVLGFTGTVALACPDSTKLPLGMTCAITPSTVTPGADGKPVTATVTLSSQAPAVILADAKPAQPPWMATGVSLAIAAMFFAGVWRRNQLIVLSCAVLAVALCVSCFGGKSSAGSSQNSVLTLSTSSVACSSGASCAAKSPEGSSITLTAAVSADHDVTGTVEFFDNGTQIASGVSLQTGRASFNTIAFDPADPTKACGNHVNVACLLLGSHPITAKYSGDAHTHAASVDTPLNQVITGSSQITITASSGALQHPTNVQFSLN